MAARTTLLNSVSMLLVFFSGQCIAEEPTDDLAKFVDHWGGKLRKHTAADGSTRVGVDLMSPTLRGRNVTDAQLKELARYQEITSLLVFSPSITDDGVAAIGQLSNLRYLSLSSTNVAGTCLKELVKCKSLEGISFYQTPISNSAISNLKKIKGLASISLSDTAITDEGMKSLAECNDLDTIIIHKCKVTDKGIAELAKLKGLLYLGVGKDTQVTELGCRALRKALPDCRVVWR